jgi:hypothetical protein
MPNPARVAISQRVLMTIHLRRFRLCVGALAIVASPAFAQTNACESHVAAIIAQKLGPVDIAIIGYQAHAVGERQAGETFPLVKLFNPKLYLPSHHDASFGSWIDLGLEPLFERIRDELPGTRFLAPLYRSPICVATSGPDRGQIRSFRY